MAIAKRRAWVIAAVLVVALAGGVGLVVENRLRGEQPQPDWIVTKPGGAFGDTQFKYLSIGSERDAGLPYWVFYVSAMMFPDRLPAGSGYPSFGLPWEQGVELPVGLTKVTIGYPRVGFNCALCHTARQQRPADKPAFVTAGDAARAEALSRFFYECAKDPRFDSDNILTEIANFKQLDWIDQLLYRFYIIPKTKDRILKGGQHFLWAYRGEPTKANGNQGHGYATNLSDNEKRKLIDFMKTL
jgi:hypothetical protein